MKKILITGSAGFIGYHLTKYILDHFPEEYCVVGLDNINNYYDISLKHSRLHQCGIDILDNQQRKYTKSNKYINYTFIKTDIEDRDSLLNIFNTEKFDYVCNLAARAGVRYSIDHPELYINSNIHGFLNILECCRINKIKHLIFASSSSVYGLNSKVPFSTKDHAVHPISPYAATKKSNELIAHTYSYLYNLPVTGLRLFTVYGSWGRPDMAPFKFTKNILEDIPIDVYNHGEMYRDFTHIHDITSAIINIFKKIPKKNTAHFNTSTPDPSSSPEAPYKIYNIGHGYPVNLMDFIKTIEDVVGKKSKINFKAIIKGDVFKTYADINELKQAINFTPKISIKEGIIEFVNWFKSYYNET